MLIYLDNCCFNRPYDDQKQQRIHLETQAKLAIQNGILIGNHQLVWSYILEYENAQNPNTTARDDIFQWHDHATMIINASQQTLQQAKQLTQINIQHQDALHVACATAAQTDCFITTDRKLLKKLNTLHTIKAFNPIAFIEEQNS